MNQQVVQSKLEQLYRQWKTTIQVDKDEVGNLSPPLLLHVTEEYCRAPRRVLVFGQETHGWEWNSDLQLTYPGYPNPWPFRDIYSCGDFIENPDSIEALCWAYREFKFGARQPSLGRTPFWQAFKEVSAWLSVGTMWSNVVRMDYDAKGPGRSIWNAPEPVRNALITQQAKILVDEIAVLEPQVSLFFSGPHYDDFIREMLPGVQFAACADAPVREVARLIHAALPCASFRTYHPAFLSRGNRWSYIEAIRALAAAN